MTILSEMLTWYDEAAEDQKKALIAERDRAAAVLSGKTVPEQSAVRAENLRNGLLRFADLASSGKPFCLLRVGDCELGLLSAGLPSKSRGRDLTWDMQNAGFSRADIRYRTALLEAIVRADILGLHVEHAPFRDDTEIVFKLLGLPVPMPNAVDVHLPYELLRSGILFRYLRDKKVALVGALAPRLASRLMSSPPHGIGPSPKVAYSVEIPDRGSGLAFEWIDKSVEAVQVYGCDVALVAAGAAGKLISWKLREAGVTALDVGYVFDALLGGHERTLRPILQDIPWALVDAPPSPKPQLDVMYSGAVAAPSDINEHLPTLRALASSVDRVTEMGTRTGVSTTALLAGRPLRHVSYDLLFREDAYRVLSAADEATEATFVQADVLQIDIDETDLLFIDTLHTYAQLGAELRRHASKVTCFIALHDTTTFGEVGEDGARPGLWKAVEEFVAERPEWHVEHRYTNNNGLTVLRRGSARPKMQVPFSPLGAAAPASFHVDIEGEPSVVDLEMRGYRGAREMRLRFSEVGFVHVATFLSRHHEWAMERREGGAQVVLYRRF